MNKAQQYINDYLEGGWAHYRTALTPMDMTGDWCTDRAFRKELHEHCTNSPHWTLVPTNCNTAYFHNPIGGGYGVVIDFQDGCGGIAHDF